MYRSKAIDKLCNEQIKKLTKQNREDMLLSWWSIDQEDIVFQRLPLELQNEIINHDIFLDDAMSAKYDSFIVEILKHNLIGVKNEYLAKQMVKLFGEHVIVKGEVEDLFSCPCCQYKTLSAQGEYFVCPICHWEDDGNDESSLNRYSSPNHMSLNEARVKFVNQSIVSEEYLHSTE